MKRVFSLLFMMLLMMGMSIAVLAERESETFTFSEDFIFNGVLIEKGTYKITFDDQAQELMIREMDNDTLASAKVHLVMRPEEAPHTAVTFETIGGEKVFKEVIFDDERYSIVLHSAEAMVR